MAKYVLIDERDVDVFEKEFDTAEAALREGCFDWDRMTKNERKACKSFYVLESVNPDEEAENHFDGDIVFAWKYNGEFKGFYTANKETGMKIARFDSLSEAEMEIERYEEDDKAEGTYTEGFYDVVDSECHSVYNLFN